MPDPVLPSPSFHAPSPLEAAQAAQVSAENIAESLKILERRYRRLFETARDGILILDSASRKITDANPLMTELLGYSRDELLGKELWEIGLLKDKEASQEAFRQLERDGHIRYEDLPLENKRGERREVEFVSNLYPEDEHTIIQCNIRDITERKALEAKLAEKQDQANKIALAVLRPMLFQPKEDAFSGVTVRTAYAMASDEALVGGDFWDTFAYSWSCRPGSRRCDGSRVGFGGLHNRTETHHASLHSGARTACPHPVPHEPICLPEQPTVR